MDDILFDYDDTFDIGLLPKAKKDDVGVMSNLIDQLEFMIDDSGIDIIEQEKITIEEQKHILEEGNRENLSFNEKTSLASAYGDTRIMRHKLCFGGHRKVHGYLGLYDNSIILDRYRNRGLTTKTPAQRKKFNQNNMLCFVSTVDNDGSVLNRPVGYINMQSMLDKINNIYGTEFHIPDPEDPPYRSLQKNHPHYEIYKDTEIEQLVESRSLGGKVKAMYSFAQMYGSDLLPPIIEEHLSNEYYCLSCIKTLHGYLTEKRKKIALEKKMKKDAEKRYITADEMKLMKDISKKKRIARMSEGLIINEDIVNKYINVSKKAKKKIQKHSIIENFITNSLPND